MKNLLFSLDSVEVSYGDNVLNSVIQINERIDDIILFSQNNQLNDFEKNETSDRIQKLVTLNQSIQQELQKQLEKLHQVELGLMSTVDLPQTQEG
jgi:hypothetical protein